MGEILLIRHGKTAGNLEGRYIGSRTDESLCEAGILGLKEKEYPPASRIYASPMRRCVETAGILWPGCEPILVADLRECDFGAFENRNYRELNGDPRYQAWIDSGGTLPFPEGEDQAAFRKRCREAFARIAQELKTLSGHGTVRENAGDRTAIVAHGGTIMAILETFGFPKKDYFDFQVKNASGYLLTPLQGTELWNYRYLP